MLVGVGQGDPPLPPQGTNPGPQRPCLPAAGPRDGPQAGQPSWGILTPELTGTAKDPGFPHSYHPPWLVVAGSRTPTTPPPPCCRKKAEPGHTASPSTAPPKSPSQEQSRGLRPCLQQGPLACFPEGRGASGGGPRSAEPFGPRALSHRSGRPGPEPRPQSAAPQGGNQAPPGLVVGDTGSTESRTCPGNQGGPARAAGEPGQGALLPGQGWGTQQS